MTHDEMITVIQAHKEGKEIQWRDITHTNNSLWEDHYEQNNYFNFEWQEYRVKPKEDLVLFAKAKVL